VENVAAATLVILFAILDMTQFLPELAPNDVVRIPMIRI